MLRRPHRDEHDRCAAHRLRKIAGEREAPFRSIAANHLLEPGLDATSYFDVHHTANDTMAQIDPAALRQSVAAFAVSAWLGAQYSGSWERVETQKPPRR